MSWYEAAAYATFAGKSLPTFYHWYRAAALGRFADILTVGNFSGSGPVAVGSRGALGPFGTDDMAGNVKEWCWNETRNGRLILGGAWNEPRDMFDSDDAKNSFERAPGYGFRLAKPATPEAGVILTALEARLKASVLQGVGVLNDESPETDLINFAPRIRLPTLMLNGRYDFDIPYEAQRPLFERLGAEHKRHRVFEAGHFLPPADVAPEVGRWLDLYLRPVTP